FVDVALIELVMLRHRFFRDPFQLRGNGLELFRFHTMSGHDSHEVLLSLTHQFTTKPRDRQNAVRMVLLDCAGPPGRHSSPRAKSGESRRRRDVEHPARAWRPAPR